MSFPRVCAQSGYRLTLNKYSQSAACLVCSPELPSYLFHSQLALHVSFYLELAANNIKNNSQLIFEHCVFSCRCNRLPYFCVAMEKAGFVEFRNVGCSYFPQSRVDCHYTLSSQHNWASNDWIGLFKVLLTQ